MRKLLTIMLSATVLMTACSQKETEPANEPEPSHKEETNQPDTNENNEKTNEEIEKTIPEKPPVKQLTTAFRETLLQKTNDRGFVLNYHTKEALIEYLTKVASKQLAQAYVGQFYKETEGKLLMLGQDSPTWLIQDQPYQTDKVDEDTYKVTQEYGDDMRGDYKLTITFRLKGDHWIIKDRSVKSLPKPGQKTNNDGPSIVKNPSDILVLVNKNHKLPADYVPSDLVVPDVRFPFDESTIIPKMLMRKPAANALEKMFNAAEKDGVYLFAQSGYRSYDRQEAIFASNAEEHGVEKANTFSAQPGESEHQTGLTMDVTSQEVGFRLVTDFGQSKAGKWVEQHASEFGFIIRYPKGKKEITGYQYEPWHLRYVGVEAAKEIDRRNITLEKYLGVLN